LSKDKPKAIPMMNAEFPDICTLHTNTLQQEAINSYFILQRLNFA
jgi:hypothetical protein